MCKVSAIEEYQDFTNDVFRQVELWISTGGQVEF